MAKHGAGVRHRCLAPWPAEERAKLELLWAEGHSSGAIAETLGRSRNAVVGMKTRLGLAPRPSPIRPSNGSPPPQRAAARFVTRSILTDALNAAPPPDAVEAPPGSPDTGLRTCQWVISESRPWVFCGRPVRRRGCAWCEDCYRHVYNLSRRDRTDRDASDEGHWPRRHQTVPA